ncbi:hypothetical protein BDP55DRAFT_654411 [Colletotrichum godetiae]|uniref:Uncharacterized protein n=1 Tax=Colletotrichum godetiae TaxID=1209918 RepID=A0AAJ0ARP7_9PEZI|nr:uncharacterized protein BDP55DRAFT_654411 [Colletotrichum godetiae]KAK1689152.1 hypothetical protein BDP55DRAFT_654411 [Colletotrichum godetiae]
MPPIPNANGAIGSPTTISSRVSDQDDESQNDLESSDTGFNIPYNFIARDSRGISHLRVAMHEHSRMQSGVTRKFVEDMGYTTLPLPPTIRCQSRETAYGLPLFEEFVSLEVLGTLPDTSVIHVGVLADEQQPDSPDIYICAKTQQKVIRILELSMAPQGSLRGDKPCGETSKSLSKPSFTPTETKNEKENQLVSATYGSSCQDCGPATLPQDAESVDDAISDAIQESMLDLPDSRSGLGSAAVFTSRGLPQSSSPTTIEPWEASSYYSKQKQSINPGKLVSQEPIDNLVSREYASQARRICVDAPDVC